MSDRIDSMTAMGQVSANRLHKSALKYDGRDRIGGERGDKMGEGGGGGGRGERGGREEFDLK